MKSHKKQLTYLWWLREQGRRRCAPLTPLPLQIFKGHSSRNTRKKETEAKQSRKVMKSPNFEEIYIYKMYIIIKCTAYFIQKKHREANKAWENARTPQKHETGKQTEVNGPSVRQ